MLENVSIIIPFQTDHGPRAKVFEWIKNYYARVMPEAEICLGIMNGQGINKSKAVNLAAKNATRDIFVIADADVVYDPNLIVEAIRLLKKEAWVVPFTEVYNVEYEGTKRLLKTKPKWPIDIRSDECTKSDWVYDGFAGKLFVITRENFDAVGGFDERFIGWGGEDDAFSHAVRTICGKIANVKGKVYHLWHPSLNYETNPHGKENGKLLQRYERASGNKKEMINLIQERKGEQEKIQRNNIDILNSDENKYMLSPKSKICFAILVHKDRELVKQLIDNIRYYCPNSAIVLYNGGNDRTLCDGLGVPVCPASHKLKRGWTTIYFLETMEWLEELGIEYEYFINLDSDALFFKKGYEKFVQTQMEDTDYMAVMLRIPEEDWYIGNELKKDLDRWKKLFNVQPFYGVFNVGQVIARPIVNALLDPERLEKLKKALLETISFGTDEVFYVNMAIELGFKIKAYPHSINSKTIRYRPYFTVEEMMSTIITSKSSGLCHPVILDKADPVRNLLLNIECEHHTKQYKNNEYPWYEDNPDHYSISLPINSEFGSLELIVRSGSSLTHYWLQSSGKWEKSETFAKGVTGNPIFFENNAGQFGVVCKLKNGGIGFWQRDNKTPGYPWYGPSVFQLDVEPIMGSQLPDGKHIIVFKDNNQFYYWLLDKTKWEKTFPM